MDEIILIYVVIGLPMLLLFAGLGIGSNVYINNIIGYSRLFILIISSLILSLYDRKSIIKDNKNYLNFNPVDW